MPKFSVKAQWQDSMSPGVAALKGKIIGVRDRTPFRWGGLKYLIGDAATLTISGRLFPAAKVQTQLLAHVARRSPAHERLDPARHLRLKIEHPGLGIGRARLHGSLRWLVNAGYHAGPGLRGDAPLLKPL